MKFSLLIAAIILGLAALIAVPRHQRIKTLITEWTELESEAGKRGIPSDPKASFTSDRIRSASARAAREEKVNNFAKELIAFFHKMEALEKQGDSDQSKYAGEIAEVIDKMTSLNPDELRLLVKAISADTSVDKKSKLELIGFSTMMLASDNPKAALAIALEARESLDAKDQRNEYMMQMILQQYAAKDPVAAAQWLADNEDKVGPVENHVKQVMIGAAAQNNIGMALDLIKTLELGEEPDAYAGISRAVNADNADAFIAALRDSEANNVQRQSALSSLSSSPLFNDFESATSWLEKESVTPEEREAITASLQYHSVKEDPAKWLTWLASSGDVTDAQSDATKNIISGWTRTDFAATGEWINSQPDGEQKNQSITTYAKTLAPHEPAAAADWATTLPDSPDRRSLLQTIHSSLKGKDPEAATALAEKYDLQTSGN
ncbi:hypothetical protein V2O64_12275 [Verrucomicrobiaceae bacterium 227]